LKQVAQRLRDGRIEVLDVPPPSLAPEGVLVDVRTSLLSAGTERNKVKVGRQSLIGKARARPDQVRQVMDKARADGVRETVKAVRARLHQPTGLGYSAAGVVLEIGARVSDLSSNDRVACGGADHAVHSEIDYVPANLCVRVPAGLGFEEAAFATVGSIALHGVRQADVRIGERVAVIGLGLVGQLAAQLLHAAGCHVTGVDTHSDLVEHAASIRAVDAGYARTELGEGILPAEAADCDAVIITAATSSTDPVELASRLCRDRGRVVVVGAVGMDIPRATYYEKEIDLRLSRSYGPGRYDREYEERGLDYPIGYVRWTERRNMAAFLDLVSAGKVDVSALISDTIPIEQAPRAYEELVTSDRSPLGIVIEYAPTDEANGRRTHSVAVAQRAEAPADPLAVGVIGSGSFAQRVLIPGLKAAGFKLVSVASRNGLSAQGAAESFGFARAATPDDVIADPGVGLVAIATRHDSHAELATAALRAGKNVFVEKPPCMSHSELVELEETARSTGRLLAVGFNRRHAPLATELRDHVAGRGAPIEILYRINARSLPPDHWLKDPMMGGGYLIGEGCHFIDFVCWLVGDLPARVSCALRGEDGGPTASASRFTIVLTFVDGSVGTIVYGTGGSSRVAKEYIEAHSGGRSGILDDYRSLMLLDGRRRRRRGGRSEKGHRRQFVNMRTKLEGDEVSIYPDPLKTMAVALMAIRAAESGKAETAEDLRTMASASGSEVDSREGTRLNVRDDSNSRADRGTN
jgi:predicted dehydrogenase/threonine dehydrogenase-like Zn-dependent dehydrogenase